MTISPEQLLKWNQRGLIQGPNETDDAFIKRASDRPIFSHDPAADEITQKLFDFKVDWVEVNYSNSNLSLWEGAAAWISDEGIRIQLRKRLEKKTLFYKQEEILAHELAHAARSAFEEPEFEEYFAYRTSRKKWRSWLGPIFKKPWESYLFIAALFIPVFFSFFSQIDLWVLYLIPLAVCSLGLVRLVRMHHTIKLCTQNLRPLLKDFSLILPVLFRLSDREICQFSRLSSEEIKTYIQTNQSLRWKAIRLAYLNL